MRLGLIDGPDLLISGGVLSQTGGHGDARERTDYALPGHDGHNNNVQAQPFIVDGAGEVRRATCEIMRRGSDQVKVMANGGAMSATDEMTSPQFTVAELAAVVQEAKAAGTYVLAHAYTPESMRNCIEAGLRSLEHGNFLNEPTAGPIKQHGAYLVPTIVTYEQIAAHGEGGGCRLAADAQDPAGAGGRLPCAGDRRPRRRDDRFRLRSAGCDAAGQSAGVCVEGIGDGSDGGAHPRINVHETGVGSVYEMA